MFVKLILPALLEAKDPGFRPIKYALFPPLGLAALAGYLDPDDQVVLEDEHVMPLTTDDRPDLVVMSVYITSASRAYQLADRTHQPVCDLEREEDRKRHNQQSSQKQSPIETQLVKPRALDQLHSIAG